MAPHGIPRGSGRRLASATIAAAALAVMLAACSGPGSTATHTSRHLTPAPAAATSAASTPPVTAASASGLSGTWHGQYGGAYSGTFVLRWHQSGGNLSGHIHISDPATTMPVHGKLAGSSIQFGTVGSYAITYTGTVSGGSMSGNWQILGGSRGGGNWSASSG